jgi:hypothetical protein
VISTIFCNFLGEKKPQIFYITKVKNKNKNKIPDCGWFISFFLCSPIGDHSQEDLAKFGNRSDMKVENFKNPFVFWLSAKTCCKILAIYMCVCVCVCADACGKLEPFFHKNPLHVSKP